jgi:hypothetical protein
MNFFRNRNDISLVTQGKRIPEILKGEIDCSNNAALGMIFRQTVEVVEGPTGLDKQRKFDINQKCAKKRSAFQDGYFFTYSIWKTYLTFYTNILCMAFCNGKHKCYANWTKHNYQMLLTKWLTMWGTRYQELHNQQAHPSDPSQLSQQKQSALSCAYIEQQIADIKLRLQGDERHRMRRAMNAEILRRDDLRQK